MTERQPEERQIVSEPSTERIELLVPVDLYRAFHRCTWLLVNETGKSQLEIMREMVRDFLIKHGC